ncbi:cytochrome-c peroxidase [Niastella koreensis]|uniref:Cytochrome-c peroxidase n=2 Tax=Niastella koreensis TaxID=354356 RepID=G8TBZ3_NIAKG|nr:cytochrome-c peroxidase [Niastella koreensis]AEV99286.1 Cytochrome-c peroxidase [Niastella koreensis GR20-10]OQP46075.1 cytochrome-c peroxidase [Niastella koreensis]
MKIIITISGLLFVLLAATPTPLPFVVPPKWPKPKYDFTKNPLTREGFLLGRKLFYDERLSVDSTISCGSCHQQFAAFSTYEHNLSHGVNSSLTTRNAPALQNLAWQSEFMWDGGIAHLDLQPLMPLTAPNEMGETLAGVIRKLQQDAAYQKMFRAAFGSEGINTQRVTRALSQYMLMLVSSNSKYDQVLRGEATFLLPEQLGYDIFKQKCSSCHKEPFFTDLSYRNTGLSVDNTLNDYGRMAITGNPADSLKFKVPSLRNVMVTFPYGHDGRFFSLLNVFEHYRRDMTVSATTDSLLQHKMPLTNYEIGQLTAFLQTLTDSSFLKNSMLAPEGNLQLPPQMHIH